MAVSERWRAISAFAVLCVCLGVIAQEPPKDAKKAADKKDALAPTPRLAVDCDPKEAIYKVGEPARFLYVSDTTGELVYRMTDDGLTPVKEGKVRVRGGQTYVLEGRLDKPGFLRLELMQDAGRAIAMAAFDPTKIEPTAKPPEDFEAFWKAQVRDLSLVRVDAEIDLIAARSTNTVSTYRVSLGFIDNRRVHGWMTVPKSEGPFPVILTMPYAGVYPIEPDYHHAGLGAIAFNLTIHDIPADFTQRYFDMKAKAELKDYVTRGYDSRDKCYFRYAILAGVRALDYLTGRKDFNGKEVAVTGSSQGGALTLAVSGLDSRVTLAVPNVAGLCELNARTHGRVDGWPHWLATVPKELREKVEQTAPYFDAVNFARKFKGKSLHGVGFLDTLCPPTTVYSAFNVHPEPKTMIASPRMGHDVDKRWLQGREELFKANLTLKPPVEKK